MLCSVRVGEDGWIGRGGNGDWRGVIAVGETEVVAKEGVRLWENVMSGRLLSDGGGER